MRQEYREGLFRIADQGDYDCLAHLDLIKRYAAMQGIRLRLEECREAVDAILHCVVKRGKGLEVNTSGLRGCLDMAAGDQEAEGMLKALGFEYVARFRERNVTFVKI